MKKIIGFAIVFCFSFFCFMINSLAWVGNYVYGINTIGIVNNKFKIEGWAVIKGNNGQEIHNIDPIFELKISFYKDSKGNNPLKNESGEPAEITYYQNKFYDTYPDLKNERSVCYAYKASDTGFDMCRDEKRTTGSSDKQYNNNYFLFEDANFQTTFEQIQEKYTDQVKTKEFVFSNGFEKWYKITYKPIYFRIDLKVKVGNAERTIKNLNFLHDSVKGTVFSNSKGIAFNFASTDKVLSIVQGGHFRRVDNFESKANSARFEFASPTPWGISIITGQQYDVAEVKAYNIPYTSMPKYYMYKLNFSPAYIAKSSRRIGPTGKNYTCDGEYTWSNEKGCWGVSSENNPVWAKPGSGKSAWVPQFWITLPGSEKSSSYGSECEPTCPTIPSIPKERTKTVTEYPDGSVISNINPDKKDTYNYTCDVSEESKTKTSDLPHLQKEIIFDNNYCSVKCEEDVSIQYDGKKYVTAGMWFKYPVKIDGNRVCDFDFYNYKLLSEQLEEARRAFKVNACDDTCNYKIEITIGILSQALNNCLVLKDNFSTGSNKYNFDADVRGVFEMSGGVEKNVTYKKTKDGVLTNNFSNESYICVNKKDFTDYYTCNPGEEGNRVLVPLKWSLNSTLKDVVYDVSSVYYSEQSTGRIVTENEMNPAEKYYLAGEDGRIFFTDMRDALCTYPFTIYVDKIARNIGTYWERRKYVEITCEYTVEKGLISYPQEKGFCPNPNDDPSDGNKPGINVKYRQISLNKVFPTTSKITNNYYGYNWLSEEGLKVAADIEKKGYSLYNQRPIYTFSAGVFQNVAVKLYNLTHKYGEFNLNEYEQSKFINANLDKYKRGK